MKINTTTEYCCIKVTLTRLYRLRAIPLLALASFTQSLCGSAAESVITFTIITSIFYSKIKDLLTEYNGTEQTDCYQSLSHVIILYFLSFGFPAEAPPFLPPPKHLQYTPVF